MFAKKGTSLPIVLVGITLFGSFGFVLIEGWSFIDGLYMTVITLTTIGYGEVKPLSYEGQLFNIFLILIGVGTATFAITKIITDIASIDFAKRRRNKMKKEISQMKGHTIVCGFGRMGEVICKKLAAYHNEFVVIEKRPDLVEELAKLGYPHIIGDAANDDHLLEANIKKAQVLVSVIDNDSDGLYITLASRSMNDRLFIIVRANERKAKKRMIRAGANKVILPFVMSGQKVADTVMNPATEDLFDITDDNETNEDKKIQLADLFVTKRSLLIGHNLSTMGDKLKNLIVIGIKDEKDNFTFKPNADYIFKEGDCLIAMGPKRDYVSAKINLNLK